MLSLAQRRTDELKEGEDWKIWSTPEIIRGKPRTVRADRWRHLQAWLQELIGGGNPQASHLALKDPHVSITSTYKSESTTSHKNQSPHTRTTTSHKRTIHFTQLNQPPHIRSSPQPQPHIRPQKNQHSHL